MAPVMVKTKMIALESPTKFSEEPIKTDSSLGILTGMTDVLLFGGIENKPLAT